MGDGTITLLNESEIRKIGLTTEKAMEQFICAAKAALHAGCCKKKKIKLSGRFYLDTTLLLLNLLFVVKSARKAEIASLSLFIVIFVILTCGLNGLQVSSLTFKDRRKSMIRRRIMELIEQTRMKNSLTTHWTFDFPARIPLLKKHKIVKVYRDGLLRLCPATMLVTGDVVELLDGEDEPCKLEQIAYIDGKRECVLLESPISKIIDSYLRSSGSVESQSFYSILMCLLNFLVLVSNAKSETPMYNRIVLICILKSELLTRLLLVFANAKLALIIETLKASKQSYDEAMDEDEFDEEAPPPSKEIHVRMRDVLTYIWMRQPDFECNMVELLGRVSVLCFTDREGPISDPMTVPEDLVYASESNVCTSEIENWKLISEDPKLAHLKPFGLATMACSKCTTKGLHVHRRFPNLLDFCRMRVNMPVSLQACHCAIGRSMGLDGFFDVAGLEFRSVDSIDDTGIVKFSLQDSKAKRCFLVGPLRALLDCCSDYYVDGELLELSVNIKRAILESEEGASGRDEECIGYAYLQPVDDDTEKSSNACFLGSLTCEWKAREDMQEFIDDIMNAGIRFVYFSDAGERPSKTFGGRLGLETDWNGCIILNKTHSTLTTQSVYTDPSDIKARLPSGIEEIRQHLLHVDDIPLHVSMFAMAGNPADVAEMVRIYNENFENVGMVVSSLSSFDYLDAQSECDLIISMEPSNQVGTVFQEAFRWHSTILPHCICTLPFSSSPYVITDMVKEARTLRRAMTSACWFLVCSSVMMVIKGDYVGILFSLTLAFAIMLLAKHDSDVLKQMP